MNDSYIVIYDMNLQNVKIHQPAYFQVCSTDREIVVTYHSYFVLSIPKTSNRRMQSTKALNVCEKIKEACHGVSILFNLQVE